MKESLIEENFRYRTASVNSHASVSHLQERVSADAGVNTLNTNLLFDYKLSQKATMLTTD